ncbi:MAG: hypothetical protein KJO42_07370 [Silicimonas sp.]|nr:hypothetical protein [Silicimonas sp.]MBT8425534.1 hypothetical protein [Silicimonas sp.]NND17733.1 hypothetical protein [Silicimonas sp.]NNF91591.1 hypothetical protein [Boseongicola sp.]
MSAKPVFIWCAAAALGLTAAAILRPADAPVTSLATSLGPEVIVQPL